jgi:hypothetical protein
MRDAPLLVGSFGLTLALLLAVYIALGALSGEGAPTPTIPPAATPSELSAGSPQPIRTPPTPTPNPSPTVSASAAPSATPTATPTENPAATSPTRPTATPAPSVGPGQQLEVVVAGSAFTEAEVPPNGTLRKLSGGAVLLELDRTFSEPLTLTYRLPATSIPAGRSVRRIDVKVCGAGSGDFWETYGPFGSEPFEYEVTPPGPDGCWLFTGGTIRDTTVLASIRLASKMRIDRIVYLVTLN